LGKSRAKRSRKVPDGPPQKLSPTVAGKKRRANREKKFSGPKSIAARPNAQGPERHFYWIAHGQTNIGFIVQIGETYRAIGAGERKLGTFASLKAAADAVSAHYDKSSCAELLDEGVS
jgi:hypothetical protein